MSRGGGNMTCAQVGQELAQEMRMCLEGGDVPTRCHILRYSDGHGKAV